MEATPAIAKSVAEPSEAMDPAPSDMSALMLVPPNSAMPDQIGSNAVFVRRRVINAGVIHGEVTCASPCGLFLA